MPNALLIFHFFIGFDRYSKTVGYRHNIDIDCSAFGATCCIRIYFKMKMIGWEREGNRKKTTHCCVYVYLLGLAACFTDFDILIQCEQHQDCSMKPQKSENCSRHRIASDHANSIIRVSCVSILNFRYRLYWRILENALWSTVYKALYIYIYRGWYLSCWCFISLFTANSTDDLIENFQTQSHHLQQFDWSTKLITTKHWDV